MTIYCESLGFQPINVISNISAFIAAYFAYRLLVKHNITDIHLRTLPLWIVLTGIGSMLWHAFPSPLTNFADVLPLSLLVLVVFHFLLQKLVASRLLHTVIILAFVFIQIPFVFGLAPSFNGLVPYLITVGVALFLFYKLSGMYNNLAGHMAPVVAVIGVALFFRTIDLAICPAIGIGTHFLWQIFSALVFYLFVRFLIKIARETKIRGGVA